MMCQFRTAQEEDDPDAESLDEIDFEDSQDCSTDSDLDEYL